MKRFLTALAVAPLALALQGLPANADQAAGERAAPRQVFDVSDLETGARPQIAWAERRSATRSTIHGPDGDTPVRGGELSAFAPMGAGYVVQQGSTVRWIAADGTPGAKSWRSAFGLAVSAAGEAVAFTGPKGKVTVIDSEGDRVLRMAPVPARGSSSAVGVVGEDCKEDETSNGCTVFVNSLREPVSWLTSSHGIVDTTPFQQVSTARGRWVGGITTVSDTGTCNKMTRNSHTLWRTCRNRFSDIAPDNGHVIGIPAFGDGFGPTTLDLLELRTGDRVRSWVADRRGRSATYFGEVWEDSEHLLVVTFQDQEWAVVRLGLDGSMEYAVAPVADAGDMEFPFTLQTR
jgi:hypothetical protein